MPEFDVTYVIGGTTNGDGGEPEFRGIRAHAVVQAPNRAAAYAATHGHLTAAGFDVVVAHNGAAGPPLGFTPAAIAAVLAAGVPLEADRLPRPGMTGVQIVRLEPREAAP